jgi:HAE1 family hydrophobic/amphiphilic exporter-1
MHVPEVSLPEALKTAMDNRPELQQSNVVREINEIDKRYYKDQTKPAIDLVGTYGMTGLAGSISSEVVNPFTVSNIQTRERLNELSVIAGLDPLPVYLQIHFHLSFWVVTASRFRICWPIVTTTSRLEFRLVFR